MKMVPYDREKLMLQSHYKRTKNFRILEDFANSNYDCVRLVDYEYKNAKSGYGSLRKSIERFGFNGVNVFIRGEEMFLIKVKL